MANYYIDIGEQLKIRRLELKRELKDIAEITKVSIKYLEAIETGDIDEFPSTVYYNLFARSYAKEMGLNPDKLFIVTTEESIELENAEAMAAEVTEDEIKGIETQKENKSMSRMAIWLTIFILTIFITVVIISLSYNSDSKEEKETDQQIGDGASVALKEPLDTMSIQGKEVMPARIPPVEKRGEQMKLRIDAIDTAWILVMADDDTVLNRILDPGAYRTIRAYNDFKISTGHPFGIELKLDDSLLKPLSPIGRPVRGMEINHINKADFYYIPEQITVENNKEPAIGEP